MRDSFHPLEHEDRDEFIQQLRDLLRPTRVRPQHIPTWLRDHLQSLHAEGIIQTYPGFGPMDLFAAAVDLANGENHSVIRWLDHWGSTRISTPNGHLEPFVTEPYCYSVDDGYTKDREMWQPLHRFADILGGNYLIDANSWHYPGRTIRILFFPPKRTR
jgi:hypothetical protein